MQQEQKILRGIYIIKCDITGDSYIGCSSDIFKRWQQHIIDLENGTKIPQFQLLVQKYGLKSLSFKILEHNDTFTKEELLKLEASYILDLKPSLNTSIPKVIDSGIISWDSAIEPISLNDINKNIEDFKHLIYESWEKLYVYKHIKYDLIMSFIIQIYLFTEKEIAMFLKQK